MKEAQYYRHLHQQVECTLCPHYCKIKAGQSGICGVRRNTNDKLVSENYGKVCSIHADPIEKKPLYHYFPGRNILSLGSFGCNLHCRFCQNWEISQPPVKDYLDRKPFDIQHIMKILDDGTDQVGIAYTYNEPIVWIEYMLDLAREVNNKRLKNVMVTNGFINPEPLSHLIDVIDAFSVDLKAFTEQFYRSITASSMQPVLETLKAIKKSGRHLEITNLLIPNQNDDPGTFSEMISWIEHELGPDTILHISRYYPIYKMEEPATPEETLQAFYKIAKSRLNHVYLGNMRTSNGQNTFCPSCNTLLISRSGYMTDVSGLDHNGNCLNCKTEVLPKENLLLA